MNTFTYIIIYLIICAAIALFVPIARKCWISFLHEYKLAPEGDKAKPIKRGLLKILVVITFGIVTLLFFIFTPLLLPFMIYNDKRKIDTNLSF